MSFSSYVDRAVANVRALIFDLDGTLVDTVYAHVLAWQGAFTELGLTIDAWRIQPPHQRVSRFRSASSA